MGAEILLTVLRLVMMGTGPFALPTFESLIDSPHQVLALVTQPARSQRGRTKPTASPLRELAEQRQCPIHDPNNINDPSAQARLQSLQPDLLVVCDYGQILSATTLGCAPLGGINLHGSLLPKYRGASPVNYALLNGDEATGVSVIHMTPRLDAGPCLATAKTTIGAEETAAELEPRLAQLGVGCVNESIELLRIWDRTAPIGTPQDPALASRAPRLKKGAGRVDWTAPASEIRNRVRALKPWPGTFTYLRPANKELRVILERVSVVTEPTQAPPGSVIASDGRLHVATGNGVLAIEVIQPAGKRPMPVAEFLRGHEIPVGTRFVDPSA